MVVVNTPIENNLVIKNIAIGAIQFNTLLLFLTLVTILFQIILLLSTEFCVLIKSPYILLDDVIFSQLNTIQ